ncbi:hypothetical protein QJS10_CPB21g00790 [Acorus calamus]|uniref:Bms1-type G domain-containing protein n=1 Tax=Acorus calamus TaxID=4465 RepID=A0AAV9C4V3_ACOCL|nr:hypothetical protein QJS10_CPB21g00790 [Acorus calamus]
MAGSQTQVNKSHKTRFASKGSRHVHRTSLQVKNKIAKPERCGSKGSRKDRIHMKKMVREQKRVAVLKEKRASSGSSSPPRVIVLFGLSASVNPNALARDILMMLSADNSEPTSTTVASSVYKIRTTVLVAPHGDLLSCMEMAKVADLIAFVASGSYLGDGVSSSNHIDSFGRQCLSVFRAMGLPSTVVLVRDLPMDLKKKHDLKKLCVSSLASEFPDDCKFFPADTKDELHKFMWLFKEQRLSVPHWRSHRPYLWAQEVDLVADDGEPGKCSLLMSGYVRAHNFSVNQLVHVSGAGDFQLCKIDILKDPFLINERKDKNAMDADDVQGLQVIQSLLPDPSKQEPLIMENVPDPLSGEQTWPTEEEMADADSINKRKILKKKTVPRGTSDYQAAWIVEDSDGEHSGTDEDETDGMVLDDEEDDQDRDHSDIDDDQVSISFSTKEYDEETEPGAAMTDDEHLTKEQIEAEIQKIKDAHAEDEEFPDEVDTPVDVPARKRFARYRGLKSFRTSTWDPKESLPPEYARIFAFDNFMRTQKHVLSKLSDMDNGSIDECVAVGSYVRLHIKQVPVGAASKLLELSKSLPLVACGLLQHESKMSVLHFGIKKHDSYDNPIKAKEELLFHVGFRQFIARPVFSSDNINSDKHKMEKFLHPGRFSVASVYGPISFPPLPLIAMKIRQGEMPSIAAIGSLRKADPDRIILKRIILTGYPQRVSKLKAAVRFMFHNPEDVRWFKPVDVWTKCGRRGRVKEPVGTHGAMKCVFNGILQQHDTVCMSLYKRVYPRWPEQRFPLGS